ncbi:MAG: hypothetical protein U9R28_02930 [Pseudomonadota bacterium]|nr:hypothetical protein [Pseudomonadota bacterium]
MLKLNQLKLVFLTLLLALSMPATAMEEQPVYGSQLMTQEEQQAHRAAMRNANSEAEREQIRQTHHEKMRLRAKEKGVPFADKPPAQKGHVNQQNRPGGGYGQGR